jgi:hypothetical protein
MARLILTPLFTQLDKVTQWVMVLVLVGVVLAIHMVVAGAAVYGEAGEWQKAVVATPVVTLVETITVKMGGTDNGLG